MKKLVIALSLLLMFCIAGSCLAVDDFTVSSVYDEMAKSFQFIISDNRTSGNSPDAAEVTVDGMALEGLDLKTYGSSELPITFVFVVDTTSSAFTWQYKRPSELADAISSQRKNRNDEYYLITFDTTVHDPAGPSGYPADLVKDLKYESGQSDYSEALMKAVDLLNTEGDSNRKVIILIADGNQVSKPFKSDGELIDELTKSGYPVYSWGMLTSENESYVPEHQRKLQDISSRTGGLYFSDEENSDPGRDFLNHIEKALVVTGTLSEDYSHEAPGLAPASISLKRAGKELAALNTEVMLPAIIIPTVEPTLAPDEPTPMPTPIPEPDCDADPDNPVCPPSSFWQRVQRWMMAQFGPSWHLVLIACGLLIALIVLVILTLSKRNKGGDEFEEIPSDGEEETGAEEEPPFTGGTEIITARIKVTLQNLTTKKTYEALLKEGETKIFGRLDNPTLGVTGLDGDEKMSRKHFLITVKNGIVLISDNNSLNGTWLNGEPISGQAVLQGGSRIRIGEITGEREYGVTISKVD